MSIETWLAFTAATAVLLAIPGPTILLVISYALGRGLGAALPVAFGVALGDLTAMTLSMLGLGALLATSSLLFTGLKWAGALYLGWLGVALWRAGATRQVQPIPTRARVPRMLGHAWLVTALNPKSLMFFVAFLPQFIDRDGDFRGQMLIFAATFVALAFANALAWSLVASRARRLIANERAVGVFNRVGGTLLIGAGIAATQA